MKAEKLSQKEPSEKELTNKSDYESEEEEKDKGILLNSNDLIYQPESMQRNWLIKHGKRHYIDFEEEELKKLRHYFMSLDGDGSGAIGVDELEDPLIALGLVNSRKEVEDIVREVDDDGTGEIEFAEFLKIIKNGGAGAKAGDKADKAAVMTGSGAIYQFFKGLTGGKFKEKDKEIPFPLFISKFRRKKILDAMMNKDKTGEKVLLAYRNQIAQAKIREKIENGEPLEESEDELEKANEFTNEPPEPEMLLDILNDKKKGRRKP